MPFHIFFIIARVTIVELCYTYSNLAFIRMYAVMHRSSSFTKVVTLVHIIVVGLNYRTAPVEVRERFTFAERELPDAVSQLKQTKSILEGVIVATCNRTELYAVVDRH